MLSARFPWVRVIVNPTNVGPGPARNMAATGAHGDLLAFIDSDAVPGEGWLETLAAADDGQTVLIGRVLDYRTGTVQYGPRRATFLGKSLPCRPGRVNTGGAGNMAVPKGLFDSIGGFDPEIPNCFEDSWLCIRLGRAGARFRYVADAVVRHKGDTGKHGDEIRMQEHNSTYAMLKFYADAPVWRALFTVCNALWMALRSILWRFHDSNAGKQSRFGYKKYGVPVVLEAINNRFRELGEPIRLSYRPIAVLWEPVRLVREALARRGKR